MHACMSLFAFFSQRNSGTGTDGRESEAKGASVYLAFPNHQSPQWNSITVVICNSAGVSSRYIHREPSAGFQEVGQCLGVAASEANTHSCPVFQSGGSFLISCVCVSTLLESHHPYSEATGHPESNGAAVCMPRPSQEHWWGHKAQIPVLGHTASTQIE